VDTDQTDALERCFLWQDSTRFLATLGIKATSRWKSVVRGKKMPFADPLSRTDDHGRWLLFRYNDQPALQAFFPQEWRLDQPFSIFWLGTSERSYITNFLGTIIEPGSEIRMRLISPFGVANFLFPREVEGTATWTFGNISNSIGMSPQPTMFSASVDQIGNEHAGSSSFDLYIWATILSRDEAERKDREDENGPDIGVRVALSEWTKERWQGALLNMFSGTNRVSIPRHDVMQLPNLVIKTAYDVSHTAGSQS
jgi:hypothetical protein